jgi:hypothetical protein
MPYSLPIPLIETADAQSLSDARRFRLIPSHCRDCGYAIYGAGSDRAAAQDRGAKA